MVHNRSHTGNKDRLSLPSINAIQDGNESDSNVDVHGERQEDEDDSNASTSVGVHNAVTLEATSTRLTKDEIELVKKACPVEWLTKGLDYMTSIESAELITRVIRLWIQIQEHAGWAIPVGKHGMATEHTLPFAHRPAFYQPWMKNHRNPKSVRSLKFDVDTFIPQFRRWWTSLQPAWRRITSKWPLSRDDALSNDWRAIARIGPNGLYLVTLGLAWQVAFTEEDDTSRQMVMEHINDVEWAYERIIETLTKLPSPPVTDKAIKLGKRVRSDSSAACDSCGCTGACQSACKSCGCTGECKARRG